MLGVLGGIIGNLLPGVFKVIDKAVPDKDLAANIKLKVQEFMHTEGMEKLKASRDIIVAEAQGDSWLQRNWRPLTMMSFIGLVWSYWLGYTPPNVSEEIVLTVFDLIKIGLGGYVVGRSGEKIAKVWRANGS